VWLLLLVRLLGLVLASSCVSLTCCHCCCGNCERQLQLCSSIQPPVLLFLLLLLLHGLPFMLC
jgi:hypothetical protein